MDMAAQIEAALAMGYQPTADEVPGAPPYRLNMPCRVNFN